MECYATNPKLQKLLADKGKLTMSYGQEMAQKMMMRIDDIRAAQNLADLMNLPGRHHPLKGDRKGQFACDLVQPYRLIYKPGKDPLPLDADGELIYSEVTILEILEIVDYH